MEKQNTSMFLVVSLNLCPLFTRMFAHLLQCVTDLLVTNWPEFLGVTLRKLQWVGKSLTRLTGSIRYGWHLEGVSLSLIVSRENGPRQTGPAQIRRGSVSLNQVSLSQMSSCQVDSRSAGPGQFALS